MAKTRGYWLLKCLFIVGLPSLFLLVSYALLKVDDPKTKKASRAKKIAFWKLLVKRQRKLAT